MGPDVAESPGPDMITVTDLSMTYGGKTVLDRITALGMNDLDFLDTSAFRSPVFPRTSCRIFCRTMPRTLK